MDLRIVVRYGLGSGGGHTKRIRCQTGLGHLLGVINERYERGALIVTSNWAFTEWLDLLQSPLLASAALDRLAHHAHQIVVTGDSFRARGRRRGGERSGSDPSAWPGLWILPNRWQLTARVPTGPCTALENAPRTGSTGPQK